MYEDSEGYTQIDFSNFEKNDGTLYYMEMSIEGLAKEIQTLSTRTEETSVSVDKMSTRLDEMSIRMEVMSIRMEDGFARTEKTIDDLASVMAAEFNRVHERFEGVDGQFIGINTRFDGLEKRTMRVEELCEDHSGRFISIEDQLAKVQYTLDEANPRDLKRRIEKLELRAA